MCMGLIGFTGAAVQLCVVCVLVCVRAENVVVVAQELWLFFSRVCQERCVVANASCLRMQRLC
jgi:hypothetical protein